MCPQICVDPRFAGIGRAALLSGSKKMEGYAPPELQAGTYV
jgi:hypothetical protein